MNVEHRKQFQGALWRFFSSIELCHSTVQAEDVPATQYVTSGAEQQVFAYSDGLFEPQVTLGDWVEKGQLLACIYQPETPLSEVIKVYSKAQGLVMCQRAMAPTQRGDCLFELASFVEGF